MHLHLARVGVRQEPRPAKVVQLEVRRQARLEQQVHPLPTQRPAA